MVGNISLEGVVKRTSRESSPMGSDLDANGFVIFMDVFCDGKLKREITIQSKEINNLNRYGLKNGDRIAITYNSGKGIDYNIIAGNI